MTAYTVIKLVKQFRIDPKQAYVEVQQVAAEINGTSAGLEEGDQLTVEQLLYGLMLPSGNDAAFALAQYFGEKLYTEWYSEHEAGKVFSHQFNYHEYFAKYFINEMRKNAQTLSMASTNFDSPHGMMNKHNYSTACDIAKLASKCMKNEWFKKIVNT